MKGLLLSFFIFGLYLVVTIVASHLIKPQRHSYFFLGFAIPAVFTFLITYYLTPADLWFLEPSWEASYTLVDVILGLVILLLNVHSYFAWFFGFNGGFSTSLMLLLLESEPQGARSCELMKHYYFADGLDKIHAWRLPYLETKGYLKIDQKTKICSLTKKGRFTANLARTVKKLLNLGVGG